MEVSPALNTPEISNIPSQSFNPPEISNTSSQSFNHPEISNTPEIPDTSSQSFNPPEISNTNNSANSKVVLNNGNGSNPSSTNTINGDLNETNTTLPKPALVNNNNGFNPSSTDAINGVIGLDDVNRELKELKETNIALTTTVNDLKAELDALKQQFREFGNDTAKLGQMANAINQNAQTEPPESDLTHTPITEQIQQTFNGAGDAIKNGIDKTIAGVNDAMANRDIPNVNPFEEQPSSEPFGTTQPITPTPEPMNPPETTPMESFGTNTTFPTTSTQPITPMEPLGTTTTTVPTVSTPDSTIQPTIPQTTVQEGGAKRGRGRPPGSKTQKRMFGKNVSGKTYKKPFMSGGFKDLFF